MRPAPRFGEPESNKGEPKPHIFFMGQAWLSLNTDFGICGHISLRNIVQFSALNPTIRPIKAESRMSQTLDFKDATVNPTKYFVRPNEVVANKTLSSHEKIEILRQWELDARLMSVASDESMGSGELNLLDEVVKALISLGDETHVHPDETTAAPGKHGNSPEINPQKT